MFVICNTAIRNGEIWLSTRIIKTNYTERTNQEVQENGGKKRLIGLPIPIVINRKTEKREKNSLPDIKK